VSVEVETISDDIPVEAEEVAVDIEEMLVDIEAAVDIGQVSTNTLTQAT
jgi:hypothetical protein